MTVSLKPSTNFLQSLWPRSSANPDVRPSGQSPGLHDRRVGIVDPRGLCIEGSDLYTGRVHLLHRILLYQCVRAVISQEYSSASPY
jgi:hypothetical protein